jgi:hypothetical protein
MELFFFWRSLTPSDDHRRSSSYDDHLEEERLRHRRNPTIEQGQRKEVGWTVVTQKSASSASVAFNRFEQEQTSFVVVFRVVVDPSPFSPSFPSVSLQLPTLISSKFYPSSLMAWESDPITLNEINDSKTLRGHVIVLLVAFQVSSAPRRHTWTQGIIS